MIKSLLPYLYTGAIVTATGGLGYLLAEKNGLLETTQPASVALVQPDATETTQPKTIAPKVQADPETTDIEEALPSFSTLRVERDGSTVIAGSAPDNSQVEILDGNTVIAETQSASNGDFVVVLDAPLKPGSHSLIINAKPQEGEEVFSAEAGLINIPEPEKEEEVTVLVAEADKPTRILQKPEVEIGNIVVSNTASASVSIAREEPALKEDQPIPVEEEETVAKVEIVEEPKLTESIKVEPAKQEIPVLIEAADVEGNKIFIAGTGEAGRSVNLYLNSKFLGTTRVTKNNAFLYEGGQRLKAGRYDLRADMINPENGQVVARAEVSLVHELEEAIKPVQTVEASPEPESRPVVSEQSAASDESVKAVVPKVKTPKVNIVENVAESKTLQQTEEPEDRVQTQEVEVTETDVGAEVTEVKIQAIETPRVQKTEIRTGTAVIIRRGDNLWRVASRNYGAGIRYTTIFEANRDQVRNPNLIFPGQVLKVPENKEANLQ